MYSDYSLMLFAFEKHFSTRFLNVFLNVEFFRRKKFRLENLFFDLTSLQQHARVILEKINKSRA